MKITTLPTIRKNGWVFKISQNNIDDMVMVVSHHPLFMSASVRTFKSPEMAKMFVEIMIESTEIMVEELKKDEQS